MMRLWALILLILGTLVPSLAIAEAQPIGRVDTEFVKSGFVSEHAVSAPGETTRLALDMRIHPGWHTYWKNSGDSGQPVEVEWTVPEGVTIGAIDWPAPHRQPFPPLMNYGYSDEAVFEMAMTVPESWPAGTPIPLKADVYWLVCEMVCIPERGEVSFEIPTADTAVDDVLAADVFVRAEASRPSANPYDARYAYDGTNLTLRFNGSGLDSSNLQDAYFYPIEWGVIDHAQLQKLEADPEGLTLVIPKSTENDPELSGNLGGVLELVEKTEAGEVLTLSLNVEADEGDISTIASTQPDGASFEGFSNVGAASISLPYAIFLAFVGGIILNLMPCVFPVLALKAIGFVNTAHEAKGTRVAHAVAYTLGILTLFVILAATLIALKSAGTSVGWGFQLQNPLIVAGLAYLLLLVGLNLSGVFEIQASLSGAGGNAADSGGVKGAYFTGALAAVVATPCTAPFMATAIGAALTMSTPATMAIFIALGLGLAAPFVLLSLSPAAARNMPKPGAWMVRLKEFLAFPMYLTAAWLLTVLGTLAGQGSILMALTGAVLVGMAAWAFGVAQKSSGRGKMLGMATSIAAIMGVVIIALRFDGVPSVAASNGSIAGHSGPVERYSAALLNDLLAEGKPVFVNMTADWCITCKVNERVAFGDQFKDALERNNVSYLVGDWTARDPEITQLLEKFGRLGVPLYAVFPRNGEPMLLPQILTTDRIVAALDQV